MQHKKILFLLLQCSVAQQLYTAASQQAPEREAKSGGIAQHVERPKIAAEEPRVLRLLQENTPLLKELCQLVAQYYYHGLHHIQDVFVSKYGIIDIAVVGKLIVCLARALPGERNTLVLFDKSNVTQLYSRTIPVDAYHFAPLSNNRIALAKMDNSITIIDPVKPAEVMLLTDKQADHTQRLIPLSRNRLASVHGKNTTTCINIWDIDKNRYLHSLDQEDPMFDIDSSNREIIVEPSEDTLAIGGYHIAYGDIAVWNTNNGRRLYRLAYPSFPDGIFDPVTYVRRLIKLAEGLIMAEYDESSPSMISPLILWRISSPTSSYPMRILNANSLRCLAAAKLSLTTIALGYAHKTDHTQDAIHVIDIATGACLAQSSCTNSNLPTIRSCLPARLGSDRISQLIPVSEHAIIAACGTSIRCWEGYFPSKKQNPEQVAVEWGDDEQKQRESGAQ